MLNIFSPLEPRVVESKLGDVLLVIWRVPKPKHIIHPTRNVNHRPPMLKGIEAIATVGRTTAGITYPTKGRVRDAGVGNNIIDSNAAGMGLREDCVLNVSYRVIVTGSYKDGGA